MRNLEQHDRKRVLKQERKLARKTSERFGKRSFLSDVGGR